MKREELIAQATVWYLDKGYGFPDTHTIALAIVDFHLSIVEQEKKDIAWEAWKGKHWKTKISLTESDRVYFEQWYTKHLEDKK